MDDNSFFGKFNKKKGQKRHFKAYIDFFLSEKIMIDWLIYFECLYWLYLVEILTKEIVTVFRLSQWISYKILSPFYRGGWISPSPSKLQNFSGFFQIMPHMANILQKKIVTLFRRLYWTFCTVCNQFHRGGLNQPPPKQICREKGAKQDRVKGT